MGRLTPAIRRCSEAVRHDPAFEEAYHLLGLAYLDRHWNRKALEAFRAGAAAQPQEAAVPGPGALPLRSGGLAAARVEGEAEAWFTKRRGAARPRQPSEAGAGQLPPGAGARSREPDAADVLRTALPAPRPQRGDRGGHPQVLELEPGEMLQATAYAALIEALRSQGKFREGNRVGQPAARRGRLATSARSIAYYEMAYNLAEMEEDLDQRARLRPTRSSSWRRTRSSSSRSPPSAGCTTSARSSTRRSTSSPGRASWGRLRPP